MLSSERAPEIETRISSAGSVFQHAARSRNYALCLLPFMGRVTPYWHTKKSPSLVHKAPQELALFITALFFLWMLYLYLHKNSYRCFIYMCIHSFWVNERKWGNPKPKSTFLLWLKAISWLSVSQKVTLISLSFCFNSWVLAFISSEIQKVFIVFPSIKFDAM